jgi:predicted PhzF superfamily epimerase YddE/YHI9
MQPIHVTQVDAFTDKPFSGNPAAVVVLTEQKETAWLQAVAAEMNLAETAFLVAEEDGYMLRWFTPTVEVDLCGHATLASAHALWEQGYVRPPQKIRFFTRSGVLTAYQTLRGIELDFPIKPEQKAEAPEGLAEGLGAELKYVGRNAFDYLVEVDSEATLRALTPNFALLQKLPVRGVIVTARGSDYDFVSRFFAPASGIPEDPVTGSAHCCLGPYWGPKLGKTEMTGYQASARGGVVNVRLEGDRIRLGGHAVTIFRGALVV